MKNLTSITLAAQSGKTAGLPATGRLQRQGAHSLFALASASCLRWEGIWLMRVLCPPPSTWSPQTLVEKEMGRQKLSFTLHSGAPEPS